MLTGSIKVNQIGYQIGAQKRASTVGIAGDFAVQDIVSGEEVYKGVITVGASADPSSGDDTSWIDFTDLNRPGSYRIIAGGGRVQSTAFDIAIDLFGKLRDSLIKGLYFQRCGCKLDKEHAGVWKHDICHDFKGRLVEDQTQELEIAGGWHDAGDYGRYVTPGAVTVAMLLLTHDHRSDVSTDNLGIPESGNGIPDILDEARWELEWMLKMQKPDGGVYHKATPWGFPGFVMPEDDKLDIVVSPVSVTATATLAAANAMAYRIFRDIDSNFANRLLTSARAAWGWLELNPDNTGFKNPKGVTSGEYGDRDVRDERLWAAASLYRATGELVFAEAALEMLGKWPDVNKTGLGWAAVGGFAATEILFMQDADTRLYKALEEPFLAEAERLLNIASGDGYGIPMLPKDYVWGSTMVLMNRAAHLILASLLTKNENYTRTALDSLDWLLGRNPMGVCYVTGFGRVPIMHPHHRPSGADGVSDPVPGLVSGGPDKNRSDPYAKANLSPETPPAKAFLDNQESYSTNEIAIYWNSPAVFVTAWFSRT